MSRRKVIKFPIQTGPILPRHPDLGDPPLEYLPGTERFNTWHDLIEQCPRGLLRWTDRPTLKVGVMMVTSLRRQHPGTRGLKSKFEQLNLLLRDLGFELRDRKKIIESVKQVQLQKNYCSK